ncbi:MAG: DHH family phosphoesterase, partial [Pirellulales bacterium]|nr:DHH family phosphoesterase [Pirellulales bacterium]
MTGGAPGLYGIDKSLTGRRWVQRCTDEATARALAQQHGLSDALARVLAGRDVPSDDAARYLEPTLKAWFPDPSSFTDMDRAASLLLDAVQDGHGIALFADYDVDGATSAAMLGRYLRQIGAEPGLYVPDRVREGYGPSPASMQILKERGFEVVVTLDCGSTAHEALAAAKDLGLRVIVIDHHLMADEPPVADALVNPNRPDDRSGQGNLAAAGVTFVLLAALNREARRRGLVNRETEPALMTMLDLAALGTICDVVPLTGFNRALTAQGLRVMSAWNRPGLAALADIAGVEGEASTYHAGFVIGPRINAGGRVGRSDLGARLLSSDDMDETRRLASDLDAFNRARRDIEQDVTEAAIDAARAEVEAGRSVIT